MAAAAVLSAPPQCSYRFNSLHTFHQHSSPALLLWSSVCPVIYNLFPKSQVSITITGRILCCTFKNGSLQPLFLSLSYLLSFAHTYTIIPTVFPPPELTLSPDMAEDEVTPEQLAAIAAENEEPEPVNYKPPAQKSVKEIQELDKDDESLRKYKEALLGSGVAEAGNALYVCERERERN